VPKHIATYVGGPGGGRADMAQAGGTNMEGLSQALEKIYEII
jgi:alanyl-tRNA synthetase